MKNVSATIITIGDELLIGQVIDTNSAWIAQQMNINGISVKKRVAIGDSYHEIWNALDAEESQADIILITGGLGPTSDDITKPLLCDYFGGKMVVNGEVLAHVKYLFEEVFKRPITEVNLKQAEVPDVCEVLPNKRGTAPGMLFYKNDTMFISMPGVPYEMKGIMEHSALPLVKAKFDLPAIVHKTLLTAGIGESALAELIEDFEKALPAEIKLAYLPNYGMVRLRLSTVLDKKGDADTAITKQFEALKNITGEYLVSPNDDTMPVIVGKLLKSKGKTMSAAESCTGGYIAHLLTSVPGSSAYFMGSLVSYSNGLKQELLDVKSKTLENFGAVSEETVIEMLQGLLKKTGTDYGIATSGIMGPAGGSAEKPVGTVWLAAGTKDSYVTKKLQLRFNRQRNIETAGMMALNFLRKRIYEG